MTLCLQRLLCHHHKVGLRHEPWPALHLVLWCRGVVALELSSFFLFSSFLPWFPPGIISILVKTTLADKLLRVRIQYFKHISTFLYWSPVEQFEARERHTVSPLHWHRGTRRYSCNHSGEAASSGSSAGFGCQRSCNAGIFLLCVKITISSPMRNVVSSSACENLPSR